MPLIAVLAWRIYRTGGFVRRRGEGGGIIAPPAYPGDDSPFYRIEARLSGLGLARASHELLSDWIERVGRLRPELRMESLRGLLDLHYRYRFDPAGLSQDERSRLAAGVDAWLGE